MKKIFLLAAITLISALAINSASAQYYNHGRDYRDTRHESADTRYDRQKLDGYNRERHSDAYYGNRGGYRNDERRERRDYRDISRDRRDGYRDRHDTRRGRY